MATYIPFLGVIIGFITAGISLYIMGCDKKMITNVSPLSNIQIIEAILSIRDQWIELYPEYKSEFEKIGNLDNWNLDNMRLNLSYVIQIRGEECNEKEKFDIIDEIVSSRFQALVEDKK